MYVSFDQLVSWLMLKNNSSNIDMICSLRDQREELTALG